MIRKVTLVGIGGYYRIHIIFSVIYYRTKVIQRSVDKNASVVRKRTAFSYRKLCILVISYYSLGGILSLTFRTLNGDHAVVDDFTAVYDPDHAVVKLFRRRRSLALCRNCGRSRVVFNLKLTCPVYLKLTACLDKHCCVIPDRKLCSGRIRMVGNDELCTIPYRKARCICIRVIGELYIKAVNVKYHITALTFKKESLKDRNLAHELDRVAVICVVSHRSSERPVFRRRGITAFAFVNGDLEFKIIALYRVACDQSSA